MPMLAGTVTIDPLTGSILIQTGAAGEVFGFMDDAQDYGDTATTNPPAFAAARQQVADLAIAVAQIIPHIQANAVVSTAVSTTVDVVSVAGVTTGAGISGPGTGTGTGSGTGTIL